MVAISAFTAHKPPVRNRELVTGQIIARNAALKFSTRLPFHLVIPARHHHATLARLCNASPLVAGAEVRKRYGATRRGTAADAGSSAGLVPVQSDQQQRDQFPFRPTGTNAYAVQLASHDCFLFADTQNLSGIEAPSCECPMSRSIGPLSRTLIDVIAQ
jgi:hypothetical protein